MLPALKSLQDELNECKNGGVVWSLVYVAEAHAVDEWPISSARYNGSRGPVTINKHQTTAHRVDAARTLMKDFKVDWCNVYVDPVIASSSSSEAVGGVTNGEWTGVKGDGLFEANYAPWPLRFYVVQDGRLTFISMPSECTYDLSILRDFLLDVVNEKQVE
jgi:hypothetical protein